MDNARTNTGYFVPVLQPETAKSNRSLVEDFVLLNTEDGLDVVVDRISELTEQTRRARASDNTLQLAFEPRGFIETEGMRRAAAAVEAWLNGYKQGVWVQGAAGAGKTTTLNWLEDRFSAQFATIIRTGTGRHTQTRIGEDLSTVYNRAIAASSKDGQNVLLLIDEPVDGSIDEYLFRVNTPASRVCIVVASYRKPTRRELAVTIELDDLTYSEARALLSDLLSDEPASTRRRKERNLFSRGRMTPIGVNLVGRLEPQESPAALHVLDVLGWTGAAWVPREILFEFLNLGSNKEDARGRRFEFDGLVKVGVILESEQHVRLASRSLVAMEVRESADPRGLTTVSDLVRRARIDPPSYRFLIDQLPLIVNEIQEALRGRADDLRSNSVIFYAEVAQCLNEAGAYSASDTALGLAERISAELSDDVGSVDAAIREIRLTHLMERGDYTGAAEVLEGRLSQAAPNLESIRDLSLLGDVWARLDRWSLAEATYSRLIDRLSAVSGDQRSSLISAFRRRANSLDRQGKTAESTSDFTRALRANIDLHGADNAQSLTIAADLARAIYVSGDHALGLQMLRGIADRSTFALGPDDALTESILGNLALMEQRLLGGRER